jgi:hypothetical protein
MHANQDSKFAPEEAADLEVVDYEKLLALDPSEQSRVLEACENRGFLSFVCNMLEMKGYGIKQRRLLT